ncbi:MAG: acylase [Pseudomonadota bacterium]
MRTTRFVLLALTVFFVMACGSPQPESGSDSEAARLEARAARVEILRDDFGVPHIYAPTDADAVFGMLYAQAEDDFPRVERNYIWAIGRLAEVEGESAIWSDLRARLYMTEAEAKAAYADAPEWLRALCQAYADGLNWYLATHPEVTPALLTRFEPWMPMYFFEGSIGGDIEQIPLDGIKAFYSSGDSVTQAQVDAARAPRLGYEQHLGSNGFAIAGEHTRSGDAMLLINPHTTFYFRPEIHVVSDEGLNAYGAVTWGQFFVYQGFNERTGWMHTSTYVDFLDEFIEDVSVRDDQRVYRYGDELRDVTTQTVTLRYRTAAGLAEREFETYRTHHGPITHAIDGDWVATRINWKPAEALAQSFVRTKQRDHAGFREMMQRRTNSSNNTVYADADGTIAYYHGNFIPRRDPQFDYSKPVDGSDPRTDWQGIHEVDETVNVVNPAIGWLQNCNSTPFTSAGPDSPKREDYPVYMAPDPENFRGIHAQRVLSDIDDLTLDGLIALAYDDELPGFDALVGGLVEAWDASGGGDAPIAAAIETLRDWDHRNNVDSVAMTLAHHYGMRYRDEGVRPNGTRGIALIEYFGTGSPVEERLAVFERTVTSLTEDFGRWDVPWGEVNRFQRLSGDIALRYDDDAPSLPVGLASGDWGALASFRARRGNDSKRIYGVSGNSFVAVVEFGDRIRAKSLLAGGQSGDPDSPHFDDQAQRYVDGQFKDVPFYRDDVEARAVRRYRPGLGD